MSSQFSYNRLTISLTIEKNWKTGMSCDLHLVSAEKNECIFKTKIKSWRIRKLENIHTHAYMYVYVHIQRERDLKPFAVLLKWAQNCKRLNSSFFKKLEILPLLSFPQRAITCFPSACFRGRQVTCLVDKREEGRTLSIAPEKSIWRTVQKCSQPSHPVPRT